MCECVCVEGFEGPVGILAAFDDASSAAGIRRDQPRPPPQLSLRGRNDSLTLFVTFPFWLLLLPLRLPLPLPLPPTAGLVLSFPSWTRTGTATATNGDGQTIKCIMQEVRPTWAPAGLGCRSQVWGSLLPVWAFWRKPCDLLANALAAPIPDVVVVVP